MNPEFRRNIWLELTPRRVTTVTVVLVLIFFAAVLSGNAWTPAAAATGLYYFIVVLWGARNAGLSVVGEIRDHTWDLQRLSAIGAAEMTWGKLFGATVFNWYGGVICLTVIVANRLAHAGPIAAFIDLVYFLAIGLIAQAVALLASVVAVLRRQTHTRLEVFSYQAAGLIAAFAVFAVWDAADPAGTLLARKRPSDAIWWWGHAFPAQSFLLVSLAIFAGWTLLGCYRAMRLELKMHNGPFVWLGFLLFMGIYVAGFDAWLPHSWSVAGGDAIALRLALASATYAFVAYAMVLLEPKDRVLYRWLAAEMVEGRFGRTVANFQGWMTSYMAAILTVAALIGWLLHIQAVPAAALAASAMGFVTRDMAIFVLLHTLPGRRRGDFAALVALFSLYLLVPAILGGLGIGEALVAFYPKPTSPVWLSPFVAWAEALAGASLVATRVSERAGRSATA